MKLTAAKKQSEKFKQNILETLVSTFIQIPLGNDHKVSSIPFDSFKKKESDANIEGSDIISLVNSQNKELKIATVKMIEQTKNLQAQIDRLS